MVDMSVECEALTEILEWLAGWPDKVQRVTIQTQDEDVLTFAWDDSLDGWRLVEAT